MQKMLRRFPRLLAYGGIAALAAASFSVAHALSAPAAPLDVQAARVLGTGGGPGPEPRCVDSNEAIVVWSESVWRPDAPVKNYYLYKSESAVNGTYASELSPADAYAIVTPRTSASSHTRTLSANQTIRFWVQAEGEGGTGFSGFSDYGQTGAFEECTGRRLDPLLPPTGVSASAGSSGVTISWTHPNQVDYFGTLKTRNNSGYRIYRAESAVNPALAGEVGGSATSFLDAASLTPGTTYYYFVRTLYPGSMAVDGKTESHYSNAASITTTAAAKPDLVALPITVGSIPYLGTDGGVRIGELPAPKVIFGTSDQYVSGQNIGLIAPVSNPTSKDAVLPTTSSYNPCAGTSHGCSTIGGANVFLDFLTIRTPVAPAPPAPGINWPDPAMEFTKTYNVFDNKIHYIFYQTDTWSGGETKISANATVPFYAQWLPPSAGDFVVDFCADAWAQVTESNETNNCSSLPLIIKDAGSVRLTRSTNDGSPLTTLLCLDNTTNDNCSLVADNVASFDNVAVGTHDTYVVPVSGYTITAARQRFCSDSSLTTCDAFTTVIPSLAGDYYTAPASVQSGAYSYRQVDFRFSRFPVTVNIVGSGTVVSPSNPGTINCPGACQANFASGSTVTLSASPTNGYVFNNGWSGCDNVSGSTCTISSLSAARSVTATFTKLDAACAKVTTTNTPLIGEYVTWQVANVTGGLAPYAYSWSGTDERGSPTGSSYTKSYSTVGSKTPVLTVNSADRQSKVVNCPTAVVSPTLTLSVNGIGTVNSVKFFNTAGESPDGNISCGSNATCAHTYQPDESVGLVASLGSGYKADWVAGDCDNLPNGNPGARCGVVMNSNRAVTVNIVPPKGVISVALSGPASVPWNTAPALSWTTTGKPSRCYADGVGSPAPWSGDKEHKDSNDPETQARITSATTYKITCTKSGASPTSSTVTVKITPSPKPEISVSPGSCGGNMIVSLTQASSGARGYKLSRFDADNSAAGFVLATSTLLAASDFPYADKNLTKNHLYTYQVEAVGDSGSSWSDFSMNTSSAACVNPTVNLWIVDPSGWSVKTLSVPSGSTPTLKWQVNK
ncbi:MAG: hypothetical protein HYV67_02235 [Candidatus Taylorbacteria bacterium]|nr:hypothetical protein [Candidatus Taylorbacteria bacterium]